MNLFIHPFTNQLKISSYIFSHFVHLNEDDCLNTIIIHIFITFLFSNSLESINNSQNLNLWYEESIILGVFFLR